MRLETIKEEVITYKYSRLLKPWSFYSEVLDCWIEVPTAFVYDHESVPFFKGTSKRGGLVHDYLSRKNSLPTVTKKQAADAYREIMTFQNNARWRRYGKYLVVLVWPGYFHKHNVLATYEEISGEKENADKSGS